MRSLRTAGCRTSRTVRSRAGRSVDSDEYDKQDARDFVLWKGQKPGEPASWDSPFGTGRPGLASRMLGDEP